MEWKAPPNMPASAQKAMEEAMVNHAVGAAMKTDRGSFLFCIPIQVGPATPYARNVQQWMKGILFLQACTGVCRFIIVKDVVGSFWMAFICGLGWYAWKEGMNITYVCCWGLASAVNGFFDTCALAIILLLAIVKLSLFDIILHVFAPLSELLGAGFAWHLYLDFYQGQSSPISGFLGQMADPMGKLVERSDPTEYQSLLRAATDPEVAQDLANPFIKAGSAAAAAAAHLASPKPAARYPQTPGPSFETETQNGQNWQKHEEVLQRQGGGQSEQLIERLRNELSVSQPGPFATHDQEATASPQTATRKTQAACC